MLISKFNNENVEPQIIELEAKYGISIPNQYKEFLIDYNGGDTPQTKFKVGKISSDIRGFYGIGSVKLSLNNINLDKWIEQDLIPIACDSFGNYIVINIGETLYGKIFFCDHELGGKKSCIGDDFKSFIQCCTSKKISENSKKSIKERKKELIANGRGHIIDKALRKMWQDEIDKFGNMIQEQVKIKDC